jgi:AraC family transcriptional regulator
VAVKNSISNQTRIDYRFRINAVFDYIEQNLDKDLSLDELASVSNFSKYHFSRIFDAMVGETPFEFIKRIRLEKAASLLRTDPNTTVTEIALKCGFNDLAVFSRNFNDFFETSPTGWRNSFSKNSNQSQTFDISTKYLSSEHNMNQKMEQLLHSEIRDIPEQTVAYIRHTGPYKGDEDLFNRLITRLFKWADSVGLTDQTNNNPLVIYHDDPYVTAEKHLRMSVCLPVSSETPVNREVGRTEIPGGRFLAARFAVYPYNMPKAWQWIYGTWFPTSGYQPADKLPFEVYYEPTENGKLTVEICVPLKPL